MQDLCLDQEEADTRIVLHCIYAGKSVSTSAPIVVRSPDTDVMILLLYYCSSIAQPVLFDTGSGNKRRLVNVKSIAEVLGIDVCQALPAYHAFSGCDYTSSFCRRGKIRPFELVKNHTDFILAFIELGSEAVLSNSLSTTLERYVCFMYGQPKLSDCNEVRYKLFQARYDVKNSEKAFSISDGIDLCMLPPCRSSLQLHARRANYVAHVWKNAQVQYQHLPSPVGNGWIQACDGSIEIQWTTGSILPQQLVDILYSNNTQSACDEIFEYTDEIEVDNIIDAVFDDEEDEEI